MIARSSLFLFRYITAKRGTYKKSGRFLHRDRPLANIYVNNQKVLFVAYLPI